MRGIIGGYAEATAVLREEKRRKRALRAKVASEAAAVTEDPAVPGPSDGSNPEDPPASVADTAEAQSPGHTDH